MIDVRRLVLAPLLALACAPEPAGPRPHTATPAVAPAPPPAPSRPSPPVEPPGQVEEYRPEPGGIGVPQCDAYLALYRACEPELKPEIMAGNRRPADAEAGWLRYLHEHEKDPGLASACETMLVELRRRCTPRSDGGAGL